jgi:hypothetical protein
MDGVSLPCCQRLALDCQLMQTRRGFAESVYSLPCKESQREAELPAELPLSLSLGLSNPVRKLRTQEEPFDLTLVFGKWVLLCCSGT